MPLYWIIATEIPDGIGWTLLSDKMGIQSCKEIGVASVSF